MDDLSLTYVPPPAAIRPRWRTAALAAVRGAVDTLWPDACAGCGVLGAPLCDTCLTHAPRLGAPACATCAGPILDGNAAPATDGRCAACRGAAYRWVTVAAPYHGAWRHWVHAAKFKPDPALAAALARVLAAQLAEEQLGPHWLLVPLPPTNRASVLRGPHLPTHLAAVAAARLGLSWSPLLSRAQPGRAQRRRAAHARGTLAADAFAVGELKPGVRAVLLIDDVMTTGATLGAAAKALAQRWPGLAVGAAVLARAGAPCATA